MDLWPILPLLVACLFFACLTVPYLASSPAVSEPSEDECWICGVKGVPFPDDDINRYVGQVVEPGVVAELGRLVDERYPGHCISFSFKIIEEETEWISLGGDQWEFRPKRFILTSFFDHGVISPEGEVLEPPVGQQVKPQAGP